MDKVVKNLKRVTLCMGVLVIFLGAKRAREHVFGFEGLSCNFDNVLAESSQNNLFDFVNKNQDLKTCSFDNICKNVTRKFSFIKNIELSQFSNGVLRLNITSLQPKFLINGTHVLAENKALFKKCLFSQEAISSCKNISIKTDNLENLENDVTQSCRNMIFNLQDKLFQNYDIERESTFVSYMHDKNNKNFSILFNDETVLEEKIIEACLSVKNELHSKGEFSGKKTKNWFADIRFKDQIVLFNQIKGR